MSKIFLILFSLFIISCNAEDKHNIIIQFDKEEYSIYDAIIDSLFNKNETLLVIQDSTDTLEVNVKYFDKESNSYKSIDYFVILFDTFEIKNKEDKNSLLRDYYSKNIKNFSLKVEYLKDKKIKYELSNKSKFNELFRNGIAEGWKNFNDKYPNSVGFITFSKVGFNTNKNKAICQIDLKCGSLCGSGDLIYLEKDSNIWKIKHILNLHMS